jgi:hypothetical protein
METRICLVCSLEYSINLKTNSKSESARRKYCSARCFYDRNKTNEVKTCPGCSAKFEINTGEQQCQFILRKYCSRGCHNKHANMTRRLIDMSGQIVNGIQFLEYLSDCKWTAICYCGNKFITRPSFVKRGNTKSCGCHRSKILSHLAKTRLGNKSNRWNHNLSEENRVRTRRTDPAEYKAWRFSVFSRDSFKCKICGIGGKTLNAHHLDGWSSNEERRHDITNGVTLCGKHHKEFHKLYGNKNSTAEEFFEYYLCTKGTASD